MAGKLPRRNAVPVADLASAILDPVLRKRAGFSTALLQGWDEIVGPHLANSSRPERLNWPRRAHEDDPFTPGTLCVACEGIAALHLQHETGEIVARVNAFLGFAAIDRVRIVQKPLAVDTPPPRRAPRKLNTVEQQAIAAKVAGVSDDGLRAALERLGASIKGTARR